MSDASSGALRLDDESLKKQPEEVFDLLDKLGEGSYGAVHKALHRETAKVVAIKIVAIDNDLQDIIKEISMMQQCDSSHVVKYYGSYFHASDLWIVMEYCGGGSVADIMRLRRKALNERELAGILQHTLYGLEYLHARKKIHRDIKAGNILLTETGLAKLADFGVAGQLSDTMAKRNTVIGTPYWMAPEVIQEVGYDSLADIWSLGITALEMADGKPPHAHVHPMRAIFMIPISPSPTLRRPEKWSEAFRAFLAACLHKKPANRSTATELLQMDFIANAPNPEKVLTPIIAEAAEIMRDHGRYPQEDDEEEEEELGRGRRRASSNEDAADDDDDDDDDEPVDSGTMIVGGASASGTMVVRSEDEISSDLGTMVHNDPDDAGTMQCNAVRQSSYRPAFMAAFDDEAGSPTRTLERSTLSSSSVGKGLSPEELRERLSNLDKEMEDELAELRKLYEAKREPISTAIAAKRAVPAS